MRVFLDMADGGPFKIQMTTLLTDEQLMAQVARADSAAFRYLAGRHLTRAYAIAFRLLHSREDAEEVAQEAISKVWQKAATFDPARSAFGTWFYRIVTNAALDRLRRSLDPEAPLQRGYVLVTDAAGKVVKTRASAAAEAELTLKFADGSLPVSPRIKQAMAALPPTQQMALTLVYYEEFSQAEAARIMNITTSALEALLFRGKKGLKQRLTA